MEKISKDLFNNFLSEVSQRAKFILQRKDVPDYEKYRFESFINGGITKEEYERNKVNGSNAIWFNEKQWKIGIFLIDWEAWEWSNYEDMEENFDENVSECINYNIYLLKDIDLEVSPLSEK